MTTREPTPPAPDTAADDFLSNGDWEAHVLAAIRRASPRVRVQAGRAVARIAWAHPGFGLSRRALHRAADAAAVHLARTEAQLRREQHGRRA